MTHTTERVHVTEAPSSTSPQPPRRSLRFVLGSAAILLGLVAAVALLVLAVSSDTAPQSEGNPVDSPQQGYPMSADAAERHFSDVDRASGRAGVPMSADAAERHFSDVSGASGRAGVPMSADAAERHFSDVSGASGRAGVPMSADAAERYFSDVAR